MFRFPRATAGEEPGFLQARVCVVCDRRKLVLGGKSGARSHRRLPSFCRILLGTRRLPPDGLFSAERCPALLLPRFLSRRPPIHFSVSVTDNASLHLRSGNHSAAVPETVLKRRRTVAEVEAHRAKTRAALKKNRVGARKVQFKRAEQYVKEYRTKERSLIRHNRIAKSTGGYYRPAEARVAIVMRIRGTQGLHPKPRKTLQLLRLRQIGNAVFLKLNKATLNMLKLVAPYVAWGYPTQKTISDLVYKRGFACVQHQRMPITDNKIIEDNLGSKDILCIEDLIHELVNCGENFRYANRFLWPFKLNTPKGGYRSVTTGFNEGGDSGLRGDQINTFIQRCL